MAYETPRLIVRPWRDHPDDLARILDIYSRAEVCRWLGNPAPPPGRDAAPPTDRPAASGVREPSSGPAYPLTDLAHAARRQREWAERNAAAPYPCGIWAVERRDTGVAVGTVLLKVLPRSDGTVGEDIEVGWHLHPDSWGHGYATEAARGALDRAFAAGVPQVFAVLFPDNAASAAVTRRLGMTPLGLTDRWYGEELASFVLRRPA